MNNQLKLLLYIVFVVAALFYIQDSFNLFDVSFVENRKTEEKSPNKQSSVKEKEETGDNYVEISIGGGESIKVSVEIADTPASRSLGLSNRRYLGDYDGMLFLFDELVNNPFWMKDTFINLDIIFIDEKGFILDIKKDNEPCTENYCPQILSSEQYKYVLEVNGGFADINGLEVGQSVSIHLASSQ